MCASGLARTARAGGPRMPAIAGRPHPRPADPVGRSQMTAPHLDPQALTPTTSEPVVVDWGRGVVDAGPRAGRGHATAALADAPRRATASAADAIDVGRP